ncbi:transmembrane protein, putative [Bodo saltans]|uniref:Transmembrane protein, putative n=1 Tax=Bodo saltans TaxID=75058 RepID=A0A0S4JDC5_BODSA|nr:transmembrane protein, putative [Bodo saltans]|eukprot:CUG88161.1 transmembrane protein, putative [Bodo saltans]
MFITDYQQQQVLLFNLSTNAIVIVAGSRGQGGSSNGFGTSALFSNPEGLVLMGTNYEWPCLYINEDSGPLTNSLKEIRLRCQYVRRRPLRDELPSTQKHVALVLHEYRLLWYCTFDTSILLMTGVLVGIANSSAKPAVCGGCGIAIAAMYVVQFVVCVKSQPFTTMFSYAHQVLVLLLSTISAASQSANIILQSSDPSSMVEALASTMSVAAACDLIVAGLALLRSAMDIVSLVKAIQKSANGNQREETLQCTIKAERLPVDVPLASEIQPTLMTGTSSFCNSCQAVNKVIKRRA